MEKTPNYNLKKPGQDDYYNIDDQNENADILDAEIKRVADKVDNLPKLPEDIARETTPKNIETKVTNIDTKIDTVDTVVDRIENDVNTIQNEITNSSTSYLGGQVQSMYNNDSTNTSRISSIYSKLNGGGMGIKSVQWGYKENTRPYGLEVYRIQHSTVNVSKSFILVYTVNTYRADDIPVGIMSRDSNSFVLNSNLRSSEWAHIHALSWQLIEFY